MKILCSFLLFAFSLTAVAQTPPTIRFGRGFAAEEQLWLMSVRKDLTPNQGKAYNLNQILFQANPERFQAFIAGELDGGTAPGLAVIFARAQGVDMKIVASICLEASGPGIFTTQYMVKDDGPIKSVKDLKGGTIAVVGIKTATDLWARAGLLNAGLAPDKDTRVVPMGFPVIGDAVRTGKVSAGVFVEPFYSMERAKGGLRTLFNAVDSIGYEHELLDIFFGEKFLKAHPEAVRAFLADYVAVTQVLPVQHGAGQGRPAQGRLRAHAARGVPEERRLEAHARRPRQRRQPEEARHLHAREAAVAGEAGQRRLDGRPELPAALSVPA